MRWRQSTDQRGPQLFHIEQVGPKRLGIVLGMPASIAPASFSADLSGCALVGGRPATRSRSCSSTRFDRPAARSSTWCRTPFPARAYLRVDPARVARGAAHLARDRHGQHRHLFVHAAAEERGGDSALGRCLGARQVSIQEIARADGHARSRHRRRVASRCAWPPGRSACSACSGCRGSADTRLAADDPVAGGRRPRRCSARRRCPSKRRWRAAAPTPWRCASPRSSRIRRAWRARARRRRRRPDRDSRAEHHPHRHARPRRGVAARGSTRCTSTSGRRCLTLAIGALRFRVDAFRRPATRRDRRSRPVALSPAAPLLSVRFALADRRGSRCCSRCARRSIWRARACWRSRRWSRARQRHCFGRRRHARRRRTACWRRRAARSS